MIFALLMRNRSVLRWWWESFDTDAGEHLWGEEKLTVELFQNSPPHPFNIPPSGSESHKLTSRHGRSSAPPPPVGAELRSNRPATHEMALGDRPIKGVQIKE